MSRPLTIPEAFADLQDPRVERTRDHALLDIVFIALCALLCGANSFCAMETWARAKEPWLRERLALPHGIPSHDTFNRVFARLDPEQFSACFRRWTEGLRVALAAEVLALDGKTVRHSFDRGSGQGPLHLVSAWATDQRLILGQVAVAEKSNEITALPALLKLLDVSGCIVTIDAMGCQHAIARQIRAQGGEYVLSLKENQGRLHADVKEFLEDAVAGKFPAVALHHHHTFDGEHGRQEHRDYWVTEEIEWLREQHGGERWEGLRSIVLVRRRRRAGGPGTRVSEENSYYISSLPAADLADVARLGHAIRSHWGIENQLHWVLDLAFREDECRVRLDRAPTNLATLRHFALNLLRQEKSTKLGLEQKRLRAGWDPAYLERLLGF